MKNLRMAALLALAALMLHLTAPASAQEPASGRLLITGSSTMAPLVGAMAKRFQAMHPNVSIEVQTGGSGRGIADARQGKADIGMASRALGEAEQDLRGLPIARDGVALVVHKDNPVRSLSDAQVVGIYTGKLTHWAQVGGRDVPVFTIASHARAAVRRSSSPSTSSSGATTSRRSASWATTRSA